jgi:hypothetical protein
MLNFFSMLSSGVCAQAVYAHQKMHVSACSTGIALTSTADALRRCNVVYRLQGHGLELSKR